MSLTLRRLIRKNNQKIDLNLCLDVLVFRCKRKERDPSEKTFPVFVVATEDGVYVETDDADGKHTLFQTQGNVLI